jgi:hypothetical protein
MRAGSRSETLRLIWRRLSGEQRAAFAGAALVALSTLGPFSFVEVAELVTAGAVVALLRARALERDFHLPIADGTAIAAAGAWCGLLIVVRLFDRPLGQGLLALAAAAVLVLAGLSARSREGGTELLSRIAPPRE